MLGALDAIVSCESPSSDANAKRACGDVVAKIAREHLPLEPERIGSHMVWRVGKPRVLLLGHLDTVWPVGTLARWPFDVRDGRATGPGVFDMKAGIVQGLFALSALDDVDGVALLLNADEELGSPTSRELIEREATGLRAVLVLEPSADGALKTARKGVSMYDLVVDGRASHAGLEPEKGVNALIELSRQVLDLERLERPSEETTVTPTIASAGTGQNVVPARAEVHIDVRAPTQDEQQRVDGELRGLRAWLPGASLTLHGGPNRPPLQESASRELFALACRIADEIGIGPLRGVAVGGGSDGNFTAGVGTRTLDGLGAVGDAAHAEGEHIVVSAMAERAALVAGLVEELLR